MSEKDRILVTSVEWGKMIVEHQGRSLEFKDCKIWPDGAKEWDWNLTGTRHRPGTQPADVLELLEHQVEVMVLSRGMQLVLQTCPETLALLEERGVETRVLETKEAVALFNDLSREGRRVAGLFHSTC